jgi:hypothetical protein
MDITIFQRLTFQNKGKSKVSEINNHGITELYMDDEDIMAKVKPYIKIAYKYTDIDWNVKPNGKFDEKYIPARACKQSDFKRKEGIALFKEWEGYSIICPDFENSDPKIDTWKLKGSVSSF